VSGSKADWRTAAVPHVLREYALLADGERGIIVGPRGDFAWMCDVEQRQLRGNLPQAFGHALLLECSLELAEPARG
jgi:hypothetical protein